MDLTQEKIDLISKVIKSDRKYEGNEDLYDDFFNETCKRSVSILNALQDDSALEMYLRRVATTAIINVLKDSGRLRRTKSGYMSTKEVLVEDNQVLEKANKYDYSNVKIDYSALNIPRTPEEITIQRDVLEFVARTIREIDRNEPDKDYLRIYVLRYDTGMTQKEIANELNISQSEVSKRLCKLIDRVKELLEQ